MAILVVDDELDIRESLQELFEDAGYQVVTAADGAEALALMDGEAPCIVILDLVMPKVSGNQVYDSMRRDDRLRAVPVVIATSDPTRAPRDVPVLRKPIDIGRLMDVVRKYCH
ncbi:MAG TPA: response regulator [Kofleriaceae bacterium]|nr:response regulator [Kofleriaceae bacterium]